MEVLGVWEGQGWLAKVVKDAWKLHFLTIVPQSMGMILQAWDNYQVTLLDHSILSNKGYSTIYIVPRFDLVPLWTRLRVNSTHQHIFMNRCQYTNQKISDKELLII